MFHTDFFMEAVQTLSFFYYQEDQLEQLQFLIAVLYISLEIMFNVHLV